MSDTIPDYMTADEFISRLFHLGPYPFGFTTEAILDELLTDIDCSAELSMTVKVCADFDKKEHWRELYYKHLSAMVEVIREALIDETMYSRINDDGSIKEFLDDNETAKATTESLAKWFQKNFVVGLPREFPQSANHLQYLYDRFGDDERLQSKKTAVGKTQAENMQITIALLVDYIVNRDNTKHNFKTAPDKHEQSRIKLKTLADRLAQHNEDNTKLPSQAASTLRRTLDVSLKKAKQVGSNKVLLGDESQ